MPRALGGGATFRTVIYRAINKGVRSTFAEPERLGFMQKFSLLWKSYKCWVDGVGRQNGPSDPVSTPHAVKRQTLACGDGHLDTVTAIRRAGLVRHGSSRLRSKQGELERRNRCARPIHRRLAKKVAGDAAAETHPPRRDARTSLESYISAGYVQSGVSSGDWRATLRPRVLAAGGACRVVLGLLRIGDA
jgi:hypothetical protein